MRRTFIFQSGHVIIIHFEGIDLMEHGGEYDSCEQRAFSIIRAHKREEREREMVKFAFSTFS